MSQIIKIKRSIATSVPTALQQGELAYSEVSKKLFIGKPGGTTGDILSIGGQYYTDIIDNITTASSISLTGDVVGTSVYNSGTGVWTVDTTIQPNSVALGTDTTGNYAGSVVVSGNGLSITGTAGEGTAYTVASNAVSTNTASTLVFRDASGDFSAGTITANLTGNASTATNVNWSGVVDKPDPTITLAGDLTGSVTLTDLTNGTLTATIAPNSVALGTDTTGNYVATIANAPTTSNLVIANSGTESAAVTLNLSTTGVTAGNYGSTSAIPTFTVDAYGRLSAASTVSIATSLTVGADVGSDDVVNLASDVLSFSGGTGVTTTVSDNDISIAIGQDVSTTANVIFNDVTVNGTLNSNDITSANIDITGNATITGNLTVNGTTTTVNSTTVTVDDIILTIGGDAAPIADDNLDRGIEFRWHDGAAAKVGFFGYDDSASTFTFIPDSTNTGNVISGAAGAAKFGSLTLDTDLAVADGGTGRSSFTTNGIVFGNNGSPLGVTAAGTWDAVTSVGQLLSVNASGVPTWTNTIDGGSF